MSIEALFSLQGKVALVTGGSRGIGRMIATGLATVGCRTYICSRSAAACEDAATAISPTACRALPADLATAAGIQSVLDRLTEAEGMLHILVNNAGSSWGAPLESFPEEKWDSVMALNVRAPFLLTKACTPLLEAAATDADPARIINVGSATGITPSGNSAYSYDVSKAAIHHLTRILAADLAPRRITVNAIAPGYFPTRMTAFIERDEGRLQENVARIPLGRWGETDDVAGLAIYLSSRAGRYMTGNVIPLDGGLLLGRV